MLPKLLSKPMHVIMDMELQLSRRTNGELSSDVLKVAGTTIGLKTLQFTHYGNVKTLVPWRLGTNFRLWQGASQSVEA